jgi:hypothetical protein
MAEMRLSPTQISPSVGWSRRAHEREELSFGDVDGEVGEDLDLLAAADERLVQVPHADDRLGTHLLTSTFRDASQKRESRSSFCDTSGNHLVISSFP